jgi:SAM-dependent methyltransferase
MMSDTTDGKTVVREYWTKVGDEILRRSDPATLSATLAGDDTPFQRYKAARCAELFSAVPIRDRSVLEVGCGPGGNLMRLSGLEPRRLVGCDISPPMLTAARANTAGRVPLVQTDGVRLPWPSASFDVAFTVTVLQHNDDAAMLAGLLAEVARVTTTWIYLFEDTARVEKADTGYVRRPVEWYTTRLVPLGFTLAEYRFLRVRMSEIASQFSRRWLPHRHEGAPVSKAISAAERATLVVTRPLDRVLPARSGLCRMAFRSINSTDELNRHPCTAQRT